MSHYLWLVTNKRQTANLLYTYLELDYRILSPQLGANYYFDIVKNNIIRGNVPAAVKSKTLYLSSGPIIYTTGNTFAALMINIL